MKKIFKMMFAVVAGVAALTACTNEPEEGVTPTPEAQGFTVVASMDDATKATMSDEAGMAWEAGDQIAVRQYTLGEGSHEVVSNGLAAENIAADGKASFTFGHLINDNPAYFMYNLQGGAVGKSEFNFQSAMTQESAGVMNKAYLKLRSSEGVEIATTGANTIETKMNIVGTLARFIIYSSNEEYIGEKVQSVEMVSTTTNISGLLGYDFTKGNYYYWQDDNATQSETPEIFYYGGKNISVSLTNPMEVNTRDAESSKGKTVYMPIPPVNVEGYKYIVTTDKATYTFDATAKTTQFNENELKNIKLNLNSATKRAEISDDFKGYVYYEGGPSNATIGADVTYTNSIGYTVAKVGNTNGENWKTCENKGTDEYLYNATYKYYDMNGNEVAAEDSWVTMGFSENNICHWCVNTEVNTGAERQMRVVGQIVAPEGYKLATSAADLTEKEYRYEFIITQQGADAKKNISFAGDLVGEKTLTASAQNNVDIGYWLAYLNGQPFNGTENYALYPLLKCISRADYDNGNLNAEPCDWITANLQQDGNGVVTDCRWKVNVLENTSTEARQAVIIQTWDAELYDGDNMTRVVFITQSGKVVYEEGQYVVNFSCSVMAQQNVDKASHTLYLGPTSATCNGEAVDMTKVSPVCDADWVEPWWENTNNYNFGVKVNANDTGAARETKVYVEYNGIRSENYIVVHQDASAII